MKVSVLKKVEGQYYAVITSLISESGGKSERMAGYIFAIDEQDAYNKAKAYCMDRYNCPMYKVLVEAITLATDQELAQNIPMAIDKKSFKEIESGDGLFSIEKELLNKLT